MKQYASYSREDFLKDDAFVRWVRTPDAQQNQFWLAVQQAYPFQQEVIRQARTLVEGLASYHPEVPEESVSLIWERINQQIEQPPATRLQRLWGHNPTWLGWAAAAAVVLLFGIGWWVMLPPHTRLGAEITQEPTKQQSVKVVDNATDQEQTVHLPDGSQIKLKPGGQLKFPNQFSQDRRVYLVGEAFFEVVRNPKKPFLVYTNGLVTRVLGTSFRVKAISGDSRVTVQVRTGRVAVYPSTAKGPHPETTGLVLTPNQQAEYSLALDKLKRGLVEAPRILLPQAQLAKFQFEDTAVSHIFQAIEQAYGVEIVYDEAAFRKCLITTSLSNETLYEKLDVICRAIGSTYQVVDAQVVISGSNCSE